MPILDEIAYIDKNGRSCDDNRCDEDLSRSIPRSLEIIGEAVKNLSTGFRKLIKKFPGVRLQDFRIS